MVSFTITVRHSKGHCCEITMQGDSASDEESEQMIANLLVREIRLLISMIMRLVSHKSPITRDGVSGKTITLHRHSLN